MNGETMDAHERRKQDAVNKEEMMMQRLAQTMDQQKSVLSALEEAINVSKLKKGDRMSSVVDLTELRPK